MSETSKLPEILPPETKDVEKRPEPPKTVTRKNSRGLYEMLDIHTGRVLMVQSTPRDLLDHKFDRLTKIETKEGPVWIEKGINFDIIGHLKPIPYSKLLGDLICAGIVRGKSLLRAAEEIGLPYEVVVAWRRENPEFRAELAQADIDGARTSADRSVEVAEESADDKLLVNALQWSAEKNDPEKYGTKTKLVGDRENPVAFVFNTGIDRTPEKKDNE